MCVYVCIYTWFLYKIYYAFSTHIFKLALAALDLSWSRS